MRHVFIQRSTQCENLIYVNIAAAQSKERKTALYLDLVKNPYELLEFLTLGE